MKRRASRGILLVTGLIVIGVMQISLALRPSLWADEVFSLAMATGHSVEHPAAKADLAFGDFVEPSEPVPADELRRYTEFDQAPAGPARVLRAVRLSDTSPPLYYLLLNAWTRVFGVSDLALRLFSIAAGLACIPLVIAIGREVESELAGWIAGVLFASAPMSLYYSAEGRMYSLLWLCVLATAFATVKLHRSAGWRWHGMWVAAATAGMLVHYYFVFPFFAMGVFLLLWHGEDKRLLLVGRVLIVGIAVLPWYWNFADALAQWRITQHWVEWKPAGYNRGVVLRDLLLQYFSGNGHYLWNAHRWAEILALLVFGAAGVFALRQWRTHLFGGSRILLWLWFAAACLGPFVADLARGTYIAGYPRYSSAALPAASLLGGLMFASLRPRAAWCAVLLVGLAWAPSVASIYRNRSRSGQPMADVARHISAYGRPDDLVLIHSIPTGAIGVARYATTPGGFVTWVGQLGNRRVPESLTPWLKDRRRILLVKVHTVGEPAPEEKWLRENTKLVKEKQLGEAYISEFEPLTGSRF